MRGWPGFCSTCTAIGASPLSRAGALKVSELAAAPLCIDDHRLDRRVVIAEHRIDLDIQVEPRLVLERRGLIIRDLAAVSSERKNCRPS